MYYGQLENSQWSARVESSTGKTNTPNDHSRVCVRTEYLIITSFKVVKW